MIGRPAPPPPGHPDGNLKHMLVDEDGHATNLEGRAQGAIVEIIVNHDDGTLCFRLNGVEGPKLEGFPTRSTLGGEADDSSSISSMRPVIGFAAPRDGAGDQVTIRSAMRLRSGWPPQEQSPSTSPATSNDQTMCTMTMLQTKRSSAAGDIGYLRNALEASNMSNRMRLASFRLLHTPRG